MSRRPPTAPSWASSDSARVRSWAVAAEVGCGVRAHHGGRALMQFRVPNTGVAPPSNPMSSPDYGPARRDDGIAFSLWSVAPFRQPLANGSTTATGDGRQNRAAGFARGLARARRRREPGLSWPEPTLASTLE
jgi:hypothetical protein